MKKRELGKNSNIVLPIQIITIFILIIMIGYSTTIDSKKENSNTIVEEKNDSILDKEEKISKLEEDFKSMNEDCLNMYHNKEYMDAINRAYKFKSIYLKDYENRTQMTQDAYISNLEDYMEVSETIKFLCHAIIERDKAISESSSNFENAEAYFASINPDFNGTEWSDYAHEVAEQVFVGYPYSGVDAWEIKYGLWKKYQASEPTIGMSAQEVRDSKWGEPTKINKSKNKYGTSEQWVYSSNRYIYLDDGFVTSIQE